MGRGSRKGAGGTVSPRADGDLDELRRKVERTRDWGSVLDESPSRKPVEEMTVGEQLFLRYQLLLELSENDLETLRSLPQDFFPGNLSHLSSSGEIVYSFLRDALELPQSEYNQKILEEALPLFARQEILEHVQSSSDSQDQHFALQMALVFSMLSAERDFPRTEKYISANWLDVQQMATVGGRIPDQKPLIVDLRRLWVPGHGLWSGACVNFETLPGSPRLSLFVAQPDDRLPNRERAKSILVHESIHQVQVPGAESSSEWVEAVTEGLAAIRSGNREPVYRDLVIGIYTLLEECGGDIEEHLEALNDMSEQDSTEYLGHFLRSRGIETPSDELFREILEEENSFEVIERVLGE